MACIPASRAVPWNGERSDVVLGGPSWFEYQRASTSNVDGRSASAWSICAGSNGAMIRVSSSKTSIAVRGVGVQGQSGVRLVLGGLRRSALVHRLATGGGMLVVERLGARQTARVS